MKDESRANETACPNESPTAPDDLAKGLERLIEAFMQLDDALASIAKTCGAERD